MTSPARKAEDLFFSLLDHPEEKREELLRDQGGDDTALIEEVRLLLEAHEKNKNSAFILDSPVAAALEASSNQPGLNPQNVHSAQIAEKEGDTLDRYRLLKRVGEGGMGVVYLAEQVSGVRRKVALKIIKLGMDTREVIARFEAERQAMAVFNHPHMAKVLDAGATQTGRPYFVMEWVPGQCIHQFVEEHRLSLRDRLTLFISICHAVQHAHQKGIIHRDLKPANILVSELDGVAFPKVIDFGIAKAIGRRLTGNTTLAEYHSLAGTPQYMSPEQAELSGADIDTRADIYSLGVILYELVAGKPPFAHLDLAQVSPLALAEVLSKAKVEPPSTKLAPKEHLPKRMAHEIDCIVLQAMAPEKARRYPSARDFADDVQRYLDGHPVEAVKPTKLYRIGAYCRRNKGTAIAVGGVALCLVSATIACSVFALQAHNANQKLNTVIEELTEKNKRLVEAEDRVQAAADNSLYKSANSMTLARFSLNMSLRHTEIVNELYPLEPLGNPLESFENQFEFDPDDFVSLAICFDFDSKILIDLEYGSIVERPLERLRDAIDEGLDFDQELYGGGISHESHEHSEECLHVRERLEEVVKKERGNFYRALVNEYRLVFGEFDRRVIEGLNLLAACLIEEKKPEEARSVLDQAIALNQEAPRDESLAQMTQALNRLYYSRWESGN